MFTDTPEKMAPYVPGKTGRKFAIIENSPVSSDPYQGAGEKRQCFCRFVVSYVSVVEIVIYIYPFPKETTRGESNIW